MTSRTYTSITPEIASQLLVIAQQHGATVNGSTNTALPASGTISAYYTQVQYNYEPIGQTLTLWVLKHPFIVSADFVLNAIEKNAGLPHVADA